LSHRLQLATFADFVTRSLGIGDADGSVLLLACALTSLFAWHRTLGTVAANVVVGATEETFYWVTITFSQPLGTALGDWLADGPLGYGSSAIIFGNALVLLAALYLWSSLSRVFLFWAAFILTRPLGATVGDFLDKPIASGGLEFSRPFATELLAIGIVVLIGVLPQRAGRHPTRRSSEASALGD
jgi:uncharacterized membrane-anchored protein